MGRPFSFEGRGRPSGYKKRDTRTRGKQNSSRNLENGPYTKQDVYGARIAVLLVVGMIVFFIYTILYMI